MNATEPATLLSALDALTAEIRALRVELRRPRTGEMDGTPDAALLAEIDAAFGAEYEFTTGQLAEHAALGSRPLLHSAIVGCIGSVDVRKLGIRLSNIEGMTLCGVRLIRCGTKRNRAKWKVVSAQALVLPRNTNQD